MRAVRIEMRGRLPRITDLIQLPYGDGDSTQQPLRVHLPDGLPRVLYRFLQDHGKPLSEPVFLGFPSYGATQGQVVVPALDRQRAKQFLSFELHQALADDFDDWIICSEHGARGRNRDQVISYFAERKRVVAHFVSEVRHIGLPVDGVVPEGLALARFLAHEWHGRGRRLAIQIQRMRTDLLYLTERGPRFRTLPFGLADRSDEAESRLYTKRLVREHRQAARHFLGESALEHLDRVLLLGPPGPFPVIQERLEQLLHAEVTGLTGIHHFQAAPNLEKDLEQSAPQLGTALGAALCGIDVKGEPFNLVPVPRARRVRRLVGPLATAILLVVAALLALHVETNRQVNEFGAMLRQRELAGLRTRQDSWNQEYARALKLGKARDELISESRQAGARAKFLARLLSALSGKTAFFRLVRAEVTGGDTQDEYDFEFEIEKGLPGAVHEAARWVETELGLQIDRRQSSKDADRNMIVNLRAVSKPREGVR